MKKIVLLIILFSSVMFPQNPQWIIYNTSNSQLPFNNVQLIEVDNINRKWISILNYGLVNIENDYWTMYDTSNSNIPSNRLQSININPELNFWAGCYNYIGNFLLTKFDGINWNVWDFTNSPIPEDNIMSLIFDDQNDLWLLCKDSDFPSSTNYVVELTQDSIWNIHTSFVTFPGLRQMLFDINQVLWIGVWNGLYKYQTGNLTFISGGSLGQYVTDIKQDSIGTIWMATGLAGWGSLVKYDGMSFTSYSNIQAYSIEIDTSGNLWIGTESFSYEAELIKFDGSIWTTYSPQNSQLPETFRITDLAFDKFGNLWIGTEDSGLVVFNESGIVVPVELISFTADVINNDVRLNWSTATETNNQGFEIEKNSPLPSPYQGEGGEAGRGWENIGFVPGHGTTTEPQLYSFTDEEVEPGTYQYRLKQIDFDGSFEYSDIVEVTVEGLTEFFLFQNYPNPFNSSTTIAYSLAEDTFVSLIVYDCLGNNIVTLVDEYQKNGTYWVVFNSNNIPSGIYFMRIIAGTWEYTRKMVLLK